MCFMEETSMVGMSNNGIGHAYGVYDFQNASKTEQKSSEYGKTVGEPKLSDEAKKYYDQLKKKYGNYDFVLVSKDEKENAKANASKYANSIKTVVLIDEEKIEKMATDKNFRKKYEDILSGASTQLQQLKDSVMKSGSNVKGFGMQINDNGTASYFAVLKKSSADQKARIEKKAEQKKAEKKTADKKAQKKAEEKRLEKAHTKESSEVDTDDEEVITANSLEELMKKLEEYAFNDRSNSVMTAEEQMVGQHIDFRG